MKLILKRIIWLATVAIFLFMTAGCGGKWSRRTLDEEMNRKGSDINKLSGQRISSYTRTDGHTYRYDGMVALVGEDSLVFWKPAKGKGFHSDDYEIEVESPGSEESFKLATSDVAELKVRERRPTGEVVALSFLVVLGVALVAVAVVAATKESCPFIYSYDGQDFIFDGEPYGGATMASLQRTDASELEHLKEVDGEYRLRLTNEVDETQHTDHLELVAVDHAAGTRVIMDHDQAPHCFGSEVELVTAVDENGCDLMNWLHADDESGWYPDLQYYSGQDPLEDTRNHITLEFPRPPGRDSLHLVSNVSTGQWGSHMIRVMLGMRGDRVQEFYDAVNGSVDYQNQLRAWNEREELFILGVEVLEGEDWVRRAELHGGGPLMSERRAVSLDVSGVEGETIRLRIHPPIGFWRLDSFHLAWDEQPMEIALPELVSATDQDGRDVRNLIRSVDDETLDFPTNRERAELVFQAPPPADHLTRTVFARTTGWYDIHLYPEGPPEEENLVALTFEPGYIVHRAMQDFADYKATGKLSFTRPEQPTP